MPWSDVLIVFQWWSVLFLVGAAAFPLTKRLFGGWYDNGYFFAKAVGFAVVSYIVYLSGTIHVAPFTIGTCYGAMILLFFGGISWQILSSSRSSHTGHIHSLHQTIMDKVTHLKENGLHQGLVYGMEEFIFFLALFFWTWVKAHEPSIRGLEKFMDFGFMQSILNTRYFPAPDMWWAGGTINYYYFGHLVTAVLTRLSGLSLMYTFNLMLSTLFALTVTMSFSIGFQLLEGKQSHIKPVGHVLGGLLTAFLVTMAGNMQTIYAFTRGYTGENVQPFWELAWPIGQFFENLNKGFATYWYANATRFIPYTIHEFPSYSFVVSDVHGHVLSLPFVLLAIALLIYMWTGDRRQTIKNTSLSEFFPVSHCIFYGFLVGVLLMTNALDAPIYGGLFAVCWLVFVIWPNRKQFASRWFDLVYPVALVALLAVATALPFLFFFSSFANGIGVNCPPAMLANTKVGPFLFEEVEKCQKSPLWMMWLLWGFFWFSGTWLFIQKIWKKEHKNDIFSRILIVFYIFNFFLIIFPEFFYVKDIYPMHFRSNTMFKLGYQAFITWSIIAGFVITHVIFWQKETGGKKGSGVFRFLSPFAARVIFFVLLIPQLFLVVIYPTFSVRSYFGELRTYEGIYGLRWLEADFPDDAAVIFWLQQQIRDKKSVTVPVIVEADGDSYTDYNHISAFTGIPTITGWAVHEWLWRGSYDTVAPRREDVKTVYISEDTETVRQILMKYHVRYVIVGPLEREKYPDLDVSKFTLLGSVAFSSGKTVVYEINGQE